MRGCTEEGQSSADLKCGQSYIQFSGNRVPIRVRLTYKISLSYRVATTEWIFVARSFLAASNRVFEHIILLQLSPGLFDDMTLLRQPRPRERIRCTICIAARDIRRAFGL